MTGSFAPDDEDDADHRGEGTDEQVDTLQDMQADDEKQSAIEPTKVDVDPALFGEWPEGEIEEITSEPASCATAQEVHEWERQIDLIRLTGACPHCDGPVEEYGTDVRGDNTVEYACQDCGEAWIARAE